MDKAQRFGPRLKEIRLSRGWTQRDLAERAGLPVNTVGRFERGELVPVWTKAVLLADVLGVSVEEFNREPGKVERKRIRKQRPKKR